jgi:hypothetical protein
MLLIAHSGVLSWPIALLEITRASARPSPEAERLLCLRLPPAPNEGGMSLSEETGPYIGRPRPLGFKWRT